MTTQTNQNSKDYFDLHIQGVGYLNRVREVKPKKGDAFWACDIAALHGHKDDVETTRFDCRISGAEAEKVVKRCENAVSENKKVLIGFKLGDLYPDLFVYESGEKKGQTGVSLKTRLLYVGWVKVDGEMVYQAPQNNKEPDPADAEASSEALAAA